MNKYKIENIPIGRVKLNEKNPRFIKDAEFKKLVKSLQECPQLFDARPLLCSDRTGELIILGGNMRYRAAMELGWKTVPVIVMRGLTEAQEKEIIIKDNGAFGKWDMQVLAADWAELPLDDWGAELPVNWMDAGKEAVEDDFDADAAADNIVEPTTKPGDVWLLGRHRVMCGDSTTANDVKTLMGGGMADLMVTDPPYGVEYNADWRNHALRSDGTPSDGRAIRKVQNDDIADWTPAWELYLGDVAYIWHADRRASEVQMSIERAGFAIRCQIIWAKQHFAIGRGDYHWKHEPCWYAVRKGATGHWNGDRKQTTLWEIDKPVKSETGHSTQKPIECMARPIRNHSGNVYDPFLGSGTTLIAAEQLDRICYGMELDPIYCDVIVARWEKLTGQKAELKRN